MKAIILMLVFSMAVMPAASQEPAQKPAFEIASIKPSPDRGKNRSTNVDTAPGGLTITNVTLQSLVRWAYGSGGKTLADYQVSGGPDWARADLYDIIAKPASAVSERDQYRVMLQAILAERFKLIVGSSRVDLQACKLEYSIVSPK